MIGAGATVFAVMGYVISKQQPPDFNVELNAKLLSAILGEPEDEVVKAIEYLCSPDPISRSEKEEGRRLIKVGAFTYHVVNGVSYHAIRNYEERKAYNRDKQAEYRARKNLPNPPAQPEENGKFSKPTLEHLKQVMPETDAVDFFNYYQSCGWTVGRNKPMKDWKSAAAGWMKRKKTYGSETAPMSDEEMLREAMR